MEKIENAAPGAADRARMAEAVAVIRQKIAAAAYEAGRRPEDVLLCAACKTRTPEIVRASAALPIDVFGENHVQELVRNYDAGAYCGKPAHLIGHLQTNKIKKVIGRASLIESVDSEHLLRALEAAAAAADRTQDVLFEINIGGEASKTGAAPELLRPLLETAAALPHIRVRGLMTVPPADPDAHAVRACFARLRGLAEEAESLHYENTSMQMLSMGMSGDYENAVREGATIVRIGTAIYGARDYSAKA